MTANQLSYGYAELLASTREGDLSDEQMHILKQVGNTPLLDIRHYDNEYVGVSFKTDAKEFFDHEETNQIRTLLVNIMRKGSKLNEIEASFAELNQISKKVAALSLA